MKKAAATVAAVGILAAGAVGITAEPAGAAVTSCGNGRCAIYFSKSETRAIAQGRVPAPPAALPWELRAAYYAFVYGHQWFAQQYANQGKCSAFLLSVRPWENQGYTGYSCNWE